MDDMSHLCAMHGYLCFFIVMSLIEKWYLIIIKKNKQDTWEECMYFININIFDVAFIHIHISYNGHCRLNW